MNGGAAPAHRQHTIDDSRRAILRAIAKSGQIRNHSYEPEKERYGSVSGHGKNVPNQRAAELRPHPHGIRVGHQVVKQPWASHMQQGEHAGASYGENGHRFGEAVNRRTPLLMQEEKDGGNQRSSVPDTNPPNEIYDGESPRDRDSNSPNSYALYQQIGNSYV